MNIISRSLSRRYRTIFALSAALMLTAPAQAATGTGGTSVAQIWGFVQQLQGWATSLGDLNAIKDDLFNTFDWEGVAAKLGDRLLNVGLGRAGIDVNAVMGEITKWQDVINTAKADLISKEKSLLNMSFLDTINAGTPRHNEIAVAPDLVQSTMASTVSINRNKKKLLEEEQKSKDSAATVEDMKTIITDTSGHAKDTQDNAGNLTTAMQNATSTREATQLLGNIMAQNTVATAYNATAITSSVGQLVKAQEVTNQSLSTIATDVLQRRIDRAKQNLMAIQQLRDDAQTAGDQVGSTVDALTAAVGHSSTSTREIDALDGAKLFGR